MKLPPFLTIHQSGVLTALIWLVPHEIAAVSTQVLRTPYNHAPCHFMQSHIHKVYVCLAVTYQLHFWQNDRDLLRATAVTRGRNGYRNKSQHRKLTPENKILPPLLQGFEHATFQSRARRSNHRGIPPPRQSIFMSADVKSSGRRSFSHRRSFLWYCIVPEKIFNFLKEINIFGKQLNFRSFLVMFVFSRFQHGFKTVYRPILRHTHY